MSNGSILLVEDDGNDIALIQRAHRKVGLPIALHVVSDGEAAIHYLTGSGEYADRERHPLPNLLLLDLKLPRFSGLEVLAWVRQHPHLARLPVVVLTSSRESVDINRAYDLHANSYLVKPVSPEAMLEVIRSLGLYWLTLNEQPTVPDLRSKF